MKADIVVIGSLNVDLVVRTARRPAPGETVSGDEFRMIPGGKGANQAVAAARLGGKVAMLGRVGDDPFGQSLVGSLRAAGVHTDGVLRTPGVPTGTALIIVEHSGQNSIVVVAGANGLLSPADVETAAEVIASARVLMLQLEIPLDTVRKAVELAHNRRVTVLLDPAPARPLPPELLRQVDIITPNESEAAVLTGRQVTDLKSAKLAASDLLRQGANRVLIKLGPRGALLAEGNRFEHCRGFPVEAVDTTAAGDAFAGGLAVALVEGKDLSNAVTFANAVGALSVTRFGAQTSMPSRPEVEQFLRERG
ncbi:MAG: ribokinase [Bacillota bacterium]